MSLTEIAVVKHCLANYIKCFKCQYQRVRKLNRRGKRRAIKGVKRSTKMSNIQGTKIEQKMRQQKKIKMTARSTSSHVALNEWPWAGLEPSTGERRVMEE